MATTISSFSVKDRRKVYEQFARDTELFRIRQVRLPNFTNSGKAYFEDSETSGSVVGFLSVLPQILYKPGLPS